MSIFWHIGSYGDIVYSLPTVISLGGGRFFTPRRRYKFMYELLDKQEYIHGVEMKNVADFMDPKKKMRHLANEGPVIYTKNGKKVYNLDMFRMSEFVCSRNGECKHLSQYHLDAFEASFDLTKIWIGNIEPIETQPIVISRSTRYHDKQDIDWSLLEPYDKVFIGKRADYFAMLEIFNPMELKMCYSALDIARVIKGSKLFIGNQSLGFALAEAMNHPRVLEVYHKKPNCMPQGPDGHTHLSKKLIERYL